MPSKQAVAAIRNQMRAGCGGGRRVRGASISPRESEGSRRRATTRMTTGSPSEGSGPQSWTRAPQPPPQPASQELLLRATRVSRQSHARHDATPQTVAADCPPNAYTGMPASRLPATSRPSPASGRPGATPFPEPGPARRSRAEFPRMHDFPRLSWADTPTSAPAGNAGRAVRRAASALRRCTPSASFHHAAGCALLIRTRAPAARQRLSTLCSTSCKELRPRRPAIAAHAAAPVSGRARAPRPTGPGTPARPRASRCC